MKTILFAVVAWMSIATSQACSIAENTLYDQNVLIGYFAGEAGIDLQHTTGVSVTMFNSSYEGSVPATNCPQRHLTSARISIGYETLGGITGPAHHCQATSVIHRKVLMYTPTPPEAYETTSLEHLEVACNN